MLGRETDAEGMVTIDYLPADTTASLTIDTPEHGMQMAAVSSHQTENNLVLKLLPTSELAVSLSAGDSTHVSNRKISVSTRLDNQNRPEAGQPMLRVTYGNSTLVTNEQGVANARVLAGTATVYMASEPEDTSFPDFSKASAIKLVPGETTKLSFEFKPGIRIFGRAVDSEGKPVEGVEIGVLNKTLTTDDEGRYETVVSATGQLYYRPLSVPEGYVMPFQSYGRNVANDQKKTEYEQPDMIVGLSAKLSGVVVDASGNHVAGASVNAAWQATDPSGQSFTRRTDQTESDDEGRYELAHVLKDADVLLNAQTDDLASAAQVVNTENAQEVELKVTSHGMLNVIGTVRGSDGSVVKNAEIKVTTAMLIPDGNNYGNRPMKLNGQDSFFGNESGSFTTPARVPRFGQYALKIGAPGYLSKQTKFLKPNENGDLNAGETILPRARNAAGLVVDSSGKAVEGATISGYSSDKVGDYALAKKTVKTDDDGKFELNGIHPQAAMALVQKDGYRLSGLPLLATNSGPRVTLYRDDEPIAEKHQVRMSVLDDSVRHAAAKDLISRLSEDRRGSNYFSTEMSRMLLRIDREAAMKELEQTTSGSTRATMLTELGEIEEAFSEAGGIADVYSRCFARVNVAKKSHDDELSRDALTTVLVESESIRNPDQRLISICNAADQFYAMGDKDYAKMIITSQITQAEALPKEERSGYARGTFAESLSVFDFEAAMKIVEQADEDDQHRYFQNIAHRLAAINPEAAEKAVRRMTSTRYVDSPAVRVAYRMAKVDLPRAMGLLDTIDNNRRPIARARTLGVIAFSTKDDNPEKARELLQQAFDAIPPQDSSMGQRSEDYFGAAIALLRYAEEVDAENLTKYFWLTVQKYGGPRGMAWSPEQTEEKNADRQARMAILLTLYDQPAELVNQIMEPVFGFWERQLDSDLSKSRFTDYEATFTAMALADPKRAVEWAVKFDKSLDDQRRRHIPQPWEVIGNTLSEYRERIGKRLIRKVFHRWVIDETDF